MTAFVPLVLTWVFGADLHGRYEVKPEIKTTDAAAEGIDVDDQPDTYTHAHIHTHTLTPHMPTDTYQYTHGYTYTQRDTTANRQSCGEHNIGRQHIERKRTEDATN